MPRFAYVFLLPLLWVTTGVTAQTEAKPMEPSPVVATIGNVQALIDSVGALSQLVDPSLTPAALREMGAEFGDPGFQAFAPGAGIAVVVEDVDRILVALEVQGEAAGTYRGMLSMLGFPHQSSDAAEGPVLAAMQADMLDGAAKATAVQALAAANQGRLEIGIDVAPLAKKFVPRLRLMAGGIPSFYGAMAPELRDMGRVLEGEARFALDMFEQLDRLDLAIDVDARGVQFEGTMKPRGGTPLAKFVGSCGQPADLGLLGTLAGGGGMRGVQRIPQDAMLELLLAEYDSIIAQMNLEGDTAKKFRELTASAAGLYGDSLAMSMYGEKTMFDGSMMIQVADVDKVLDSYESILKTLTEPPLSDLLSSLGQKWAVDFQRDARKIGPISVHQLVMKIEMDPALATDPSSGAMFEQLANGITFSFAAPKPNVLLASFGDVDIAKLMQRAGAPTPPAPLESVKSHGPGGFAYYDVDFGTVMAASFSSLPADMPGVAEMKRMVEAAKGNPMTMAAFTGSGTMRAVMRFPSAMIVGFAKAAGNSRADQANRMIAESDMQTLGMACDMYKLDHGEYPTSYDDLTDEDAPMTYLKTIPLDPWTKKPYLWIEGENGPVFMSLGADMSEGGTGINADIRSDSD